ncbi:WD40 repeat-like protein [Fomitiporia mediterranea MF3/22]|uniref:WD40 repeat-like protein n=1 Tax=Fomitiporia mediterranea (strain MF3/22) TaxID=694068 RepID=UPI0004408A43|nr:WD40 repeat-like protein [Fomitiporia mediterranea MF3/22]EJC98713.1 WD40 repeat-like protein [Fomitiporia mediterranea MF3/22]
MVPLIQITADEVNHIVYSYLQDSGFLHTAFALRVEGRLEQSKHFNDYVPRGELVELLTKALLYTEVETHCKGDGLITDCKAPFSLLKPHECAVDLMDDGVSGTADKVGKLTVSNGVLEAPLKRKASIPAEGDAQNRRIKRSLEPESADTNTGVSRDSPISIPDDRLITPSPERDGSPMSVSVVPSNGGRMRSKSRTRKEPGPGDSTTSPKAILLLRGHTQEVFVCAWNPAKHELLATGSKDATARIWNLPYPPDDPSQFAEAPDKPPIVLKHISDELQRDITTFDWSSDGNLLATGSFDSFVRIWTVSGEPYMSHPQHQGPIFATKFSNSGRWLLSGSLDGTACVWNVAEKKLHMQFRCHDECCLDVTWLDESIFASCGADKIIKIMRISDQNPLLALQGHENEVNQVKFNASKTRLASCSDDKTVRIWEIGKLLTQSERLDNVECMTLSGHTDSSANLAWCPERPDRTNEIIASSAFDGSIRIWDATAGTCLHAIHDHKQATYTLTFSPDGRFLATGGGDGWLYVYNVTTGKQVWSWFAGSEKSGIYEVTWQQVDRLNRIALCLESNYVAVVDVTRVPALMEVK